MMTASWQVTTDDVVSYCAKISRNQTTRREHRASDASAMQLEIDAATHKQNKATSRCNCIITVVGNSENWRIIWLSGIPVRHLRDAALMHIGLDPTASSSSTSSNHEILHQQHLHDTVIVPVGLDVQRNAYALTFVNGHSQIFCKKQKKRFWRFTCQWKYVRIKLGDADKHIFLISAHVVNAEKIKDRADRWAWSCTFVALLTSLTRAGMR